MNRRTIRTALFLVSATLTAPAQTTRYAYTPILTNSVHSNWNGEGKQARDVFFPAKMIAAAADGSVYTLFTGNSRVARIAPSGTVTQVLRAGSTPFSPEVSAPALGGMLYPNDIAVNPDGLLYFADSSWSRIFRVDNNGIASLVAGTGKRGFSGDTNSAVDAQLNWPTSLAFDSDRTLYFVDALNNRIRSVDRSGIIRTVAGNGQTGEPTSGSLALNAPMTNVNDLGIDGAGNLYVLRGNATLWKIEKATGVVRLWAGGRTTWIAVTDGMQATQVQLQGLASVAVEADGTAYLAWSGAAHYQVLRVTPAGLLQIVAGTGTQGYAGDGGAARQAQLAAPRSVATDRQGSIYLLDQVMVRKIDSKGIISTIGGAPGGPAMGEDGPVSAAQLMNYTTIARGPDGLLYFAEYFTSTVWKIDAGGILRRVAGNGITGFGGDGGQARNAMLDWPEALCFDKQGNLFIFDNGNSRIRKVATNQTISTVVGGFETAGAVADPTDPVAGTKIGFSSPWGCTVDPQGNLVYTDFTWKGVYRLDSAGMVKRVVGIGGFPDGFGGDGGAATAAKLAAPRGLGYDSKGNLYIADKGNHRIRKVTTTGTISTFAGTGTAGFSGDGGLATAAQLNGPFELAVDAQDNVFVFEMEGRRIRRITAEGRIDTVAGGGSSMTPGIEATSLTLNTSFWIGLTTGAGGALHLADGNEIATLEPGQIFSNWVAHGASFQTGAVSPGQVVTYWGLQMGPKDMALASYDASGQLATSVAGAKVFFDGMQAPLIYVSEGQSSAIVPYGVTGTTKMQVEYNGKRTNTIPLSVVPTWPGIFTYSAGTGQAVIVNTDGTFNSTSNPVERNGWVVFFVSGQGLTNPRIGDGQLPVAPIFPAPAAPVRIFFGDVEVPGADIWSGLIYQGVLQVNVKVPDSATPGAAVALRIRIGDRDSQGGVTVAVK